jgi:hypothetical protein
MSKTHRTGVVVVVRELKALLNVVDEKGFFMFIPGIEPQMSTISHSAR